MHFYTPIKIYRTFLKKRYECLGGDHVDLSNCTQIQLTRRVQFDGTNCGVICLKVYIPANYRTWENFSGVKHWQMH